MTQKLGVIQVVIEVDYDKMIPEENLEAVLAYSGEDSREGAVSAHLKMLAEKVEAVVKDKPFVAYNIDGNILPRLEAELPVEETVIKMEAEEAEEGMDEAEEEEVDYKDINKILVKKLDDAILAVTLEHGIPESIKVNKEMLTAVNSEMLRATGYDEEDEHETRIDVTYYQGFPLYLEGMEEHAIITYKKYSDREIGEYTVSWN